MFISTDQTGYPVDFKKKVLSNEPGHFTLRTSADGSPVCSGEAVYEGFDRSAGEDVYVFDFSQVKEPGRYFVEAGTDDKSDTVRSYDFNISADVYDELHRALIKALYFQRCGCALTEKYAGKYIHPACHTGSSIMLEDHINKTENPQRYEMQGGWHDAGDFGRYSTAAAVALGHLLYAFELFPESFGDALNIPETGNGVPDVLNECRYELEWLFKMQAPDGGVYHKLTAFNHAEFMMPEEDKSQFLIFPVSSMAAADFCAIMCVASRVYRTYDAEFSDRAKAAAERSFEWVLAHDYTGFWNPPGCNTGEYDDDCDTDERFWAAAEMVRTFGNEADKALDMLKNIAAMPIPRTDFGWTDTAGFGMMSVITDPLNNAGEELRAQMLSELKDQAGKYLETASESGYGIAMEPEDFVWGSNMVVCNRAILMILAALKTDDLTLKEQYTQCAEDHLHYLLGRNPLNRSYVSGFGPGAVRDQHNRFTACDGIDDPMPGWVSGGPFKTPCDEAAKAVIPEGTAPMKCHVDAVGSYSTNEITIYWNSPAVFITAYIKSLWI